MLLENLPYYTVKNIKVYDKQTDRSEALGHNVDPTKYVMDVALKSEYTNGAIGNIEGAGGTRERWLGRAFLLGYSDLFRLTLYANINNMGEQGFVNRSGHYASGISPRSLTTVRKGAAEIGYFPKSKRVKNTLMAEYASTTDNEASRRRSELFMEARALTSVTEAINKTSSRRVKVDESFTYMKPFYLRADVSFSHTKRSNAMNTAYNDWDDGLTTTMRTEGFGENKDWKFRADLRSSFNVGKAGQHINLYAVADHTSNNSEQARKYSTHRHKVPSYEERFNLNDVRNRNTWYMLMADYGFNLTPGLKWDLSLISQYAEKVSHDYLYHPDTLLLPSELDALNAITDINNSYDSRQKGWRGSFNLKLTRRMLREDSDKYYYDRWRLALNMPYNLTTLDYKRGILDVEKQQNNLFFNPSFHYNLPLKKSIALRSTYATKVSHLRL